MGKKITKSKNTNIGENVDQWELKYRWQGCKLKEQSGILFQKIIILIPHNLAVTLLYLYSREILVACRRHSYVHRNTVYYSKKWKQFINPSMGEYINYDTYHISTVA